MQCDVIYWHYDVMMQIESNLLFGNRVLALVNRVIWAIYIKKKHVKAMMTYATNSINRVPIVNIAPKSSIRDKVEQGNSDY